MDTLHYATANIIWIVFPVRLKWSSSRAMNQTKPKWKKSLDVNRNVKHWIYHLRYEYEIAFVVYWLFRSVKRIREKYPFWAVKTMRFPSAMALISCPNERTTLCFVSKTRLLISRGPDEQTHAEEQKTHRLTTYENKPKELLLIGL